MRKPSQQLRKLIRSLSPQELKYVRQEISSNKDIDSDQYLRMMDLIFQAEAPYDESAVRTKMKSGYFVTHFSQAKANLYSIISGILLRFYRQKDIAVDYLERLAWIELLSQRDMSSQLDEQLGGLQDTAKRSGLLWMQFLLQQWQFKAAIQSGNPERLQQQIDHLNGEGAILLRNMNVWQRVQEINLRTMHYYHSQGTIVSDEMSKGIEKLFQELNELETLEKLTTEVRLYIALSKFFYFYFRNDNRILQQAYLALDLEQSMAEMGKASATDVIKRLTAVMNVCFSQSRSDEAENAYNQIRAISEEEQGPWLHRRGMRAQTVLWMNWLSEGKVEDAIKSMEAVGTPNFSQEDDTVFLAYWYVVKCLVYLSGMRYDRVLDHCIQLEKLVTSDLSTDHFVMLRLCQLICAFKERDVVGFNSLYRSSVRAFEMRGIYDDSLKWFCACLNSCRKDTDRSRKQMLSDFCHKFYAHPDQKQLALSNVMVVVYWAEAESKGVSVEMLIKEKISSEKSSSV
jgi:hypothetical protein